MPQDSQDSVHTTSGEAGGLNADLHARTLLEASIDMLVTINHEGQITDANESAVRATGYAREDLVGSDFSGHFTEPDMAQQGYRLVFAEGELRDYPLTLRNRAGVLTEVLCNAALYTDPTTHEVGVVASSRDVTVQRRDEAAMRARDEELESAIALRNEEVRKASEERENSGRWFQAIVSAASDVVIVINNKAELLFANPAAERMLGLSAQEQLGRNVLDLVHPDDRGAVTKALERDITQPGTHPPGTYRFRAGSGEWRHLEITATNCLDDPAVGGVVIDARDVTDEINLRRALLTIGRVNQDLVRSPDEVSLLVAICRTIVDAGGYRFAWVGYADHDEQFTVRPVASSGHGDELKAISVSWADNEYGQGPIGLAIRTGRVQMESDLRRTLASPEIRAAAMRFNLQTSCVLPLLVNGEVIGALSIYATEPRAFGPAEVALFSELGDALSFGIGRLRDAEALAASEERFRLLAAAAPIGILESPVMGVVDYANARMAEISGRDTRTFFGNGWIDAIHPEDRPAFLEFLERTAPLSKRETTELRFQRPDGAVRHVRVSMAPKSDSHDIGAVTIVEDITEAVGAQEQLTHLALYDSLTGLPNRALFLDRLNQELAGRRGNGSQIAVMFLDLDHFKVVNDSLGHQAGDTVLREVGARLMNGVRSGETTARFGGDEFLFLVRAVDTSEHAAMVARRLLAGLEMPIRCGDQDITVTGSIGIVLPGPDADAESILRDGDTAMYQAKRAGRNTYALFDEDLHHRSVERLAVETGLRQAIDRGEFELYYQPVVELRTGRPISAEALIRWHHPTRGMVAPLEFIPVAEDAGLIKPIGDWVFEQAMSQMASWDAQEGGPHLQSLAVNLSARQLADPETPRMVQDILDRCGIAPIRVLLEVTETVAMDESPLTRDSLTALKELGFQVAIDDFGTGYSSLAYLHTLPVTTIKVDQSFVARIGDDGPEPVVRAIIEMSHAMDLTVIAEGVENELQRAVLSDMACDLVQGFYYGKPMPAADFVTWWGEEEAALRRIS
ncbi:MAG: EAL domain-containing protein [Acidimicrobiales bacterium]